MDNEFSEKGVSGFKASAKDRNAIQDIQKMALQGAFDILLVFMFDRLGRRDDETPFVVEWFVKQGIEVWSAQEGRYTGGQVPFGYRLEKTSRFNKKNQEVRDYAVEPEDAEIARLVFQKYVHEGCGAKLILVTAGRRYQKKDGTGEMDAEFRDYYRQRHGQDPEEVLGSPASPEETQARREAFLEDLE